MNKNWKCILGVVILSLLGVIITALIMGGAAVKIVAVFLACCAISVLGAGLWVALCEHCDECCGIKPNNKEEP